MSIDFWDRFWALLAADGAHSWYKFFIGCYMALGCVYFASALLKTPFPPRKNILIFVGASCFSWLWNVVGGIELSIYMPGFYAAFILLLIVIYKQAWRNAIFLALIHYFSVGYVTRVMWWIYKAVGGNFHVEAGVPYWDEPWIHIMTACAMLAILYFVRIQVRKIADYKLQMREFISVMVMTLPLAYFSYTITLRSVANNDLPLGILVVWFILSIGVILDMVLGRKQQQELAELRVIEQHLQEQYQRYQIKAESSELIMQKCHDLQKHLRLFQETSNSGYLDAYQAELEATIDDYDTVYETGNAMLDSVLSEAARKCRAEKISLICMADGTLVDFIDPIDICSIFGNALDNAFESARSLADPEKRLIHLKIYQEKFLLLFRVENYYQHDLHWQDGNLMTAKPDRANHGYGLKSIRYAVEKYKGNVRVAAQEGKFTLTVLLNR
jgi:hypothetical protein